MTTNSSQALTFSLPGDPHVAAVTWYPEDHSGTEVLARINAALPRSWEGREIVATAPGLVGPVRLRAFTTDVEVFIQVFLRREYDVPLRFTPKFVVDGGANIGLTSLFFAAAYPDTAIVAVEAERSNHALLERNISGHARITARHAAIWDRTATLKVFGPKSDHPAREYNKWGFMVAEGSDASFTDAVRAQAAEVDEVQGVSIGDLLEASGRDRIDLLKLDIEGAEREVFASPESRGWLASVRAIMVETHDSQKDGCSAALHRAIAGRRYRESRRGDVTVVEFEDA